jgi:hypothetical protein
MKPGPKPRAAAVADAADAAIDLELDEISTCASHFFGRRIFFLFVPCAESALLDQEQLSHFNQRSSHS